MRKGLTPFNIAALTLGFALLYVPILALVTYSFNEGRLVAVWQGFSLRWYGEVWNNRQLIDSAWITLRAGALSASIALVAGTAAAMVLARAGRFLGRSGFATLVYVPLVMPEVVMGLALLLLFVSADIERGFVTLALSHASFSAAFVAVVVHSRLVTLDRSIEEAAMDLGATPWRTFLFITAPMLAPALAAGWLLAFTLSLDDLVIASFTTGPGATTLPMRIYSQVRLGVTPEINAISTMFIAGVAAIVVVASLVNKGLMGERK